MKKLHYKWFMIFAALLLVTIKGNGQTTLPEELTKNTIKEQINYVVEHTRIYENYRAIREDIFQKINTNFIDSLSSGKSRIAILNNMTSALNIKTDSLNALLETTRASLKEITITKNNIKVLGFELDKVTYNSIMWIIVAVLVFVLVVGFLVFRRNLFVTIRTGKELNELKDEFQAYRQSSRIAREKLEMDHFNEMKKLKGK